MTLFPTGVAAPPRSSLPLEAQALSNRIFHGTLALPVHQSVELGCAKAARRLRFPSSGQRLLRRGSRNGSTLRSSARSAHHAGHAHAVFLCRRSLPSSRRPDVPEGIIVAPLSPIWMPLVEDGLACAITSVKESKHQKG
ncbi:hypothetical protein E2562_031511, partial [Oryza meyeriana var. granulata]